MSPSSNHLLMAVFQIRSHSKLLSLQLAALIIFNEENLQTQLFVIDLLSVTST